MRRKRSALANPLVTGIRRDRPCFWGEPRFGKKDKSLPREPKEKRKGGGVSERRFWKRGESIKDRRRAKIRRTNPRSQKGAFGVWVLRNGRVSSGREGNQTHDAGRGGLRGDNGL